MSVRLEPFCANDFSIRGSGRRVTAQVLTQRGRDKTTRQFNMTDGVVPWSQDPDLALATVWHRHGQNNNTSAVLISGTGLQAGALATTYAHDCHNLVVLGTNPEDMAIAAKVLISTGGGYVAVSEATCRRW